MFYFYILAGMFVAVVALFKRDLLVQRESCRVVLAISIALFIAGVLLHFTDAGRADPTGALLTPLMSLGLYRLLRRIFLRKFQHEPRDTYLNWTPGFAEDRLFNILYFAVCGWLLLANMIGMSELTKSGWQLAWPTQIWI
jgi:hypothetical protein